MRTSKIIFGRSVQFRLERSSWAKEMTLYILPTIQLVYISGLALDDDGSHFLAFPGFWNLEFAWPKFQFTICINDK